LKTLPTIWTHVKSLLLLLLRDTVYFNVNACNCSKIVTSCCPSGAIIFSTGPKQKVLWFELFYSVFLNMDV